MENDMNVKRSLPQGSSSTGLLHRIVAAVFFATLIPFMAAQAPAAPAGRQGPPPTPPTAGAHLEIIDGSSGTYRVQEQFVGINFPSDAVATSPTVAGTLVIAPDGLIVTAQSKLTIDLRALKSDQDQRDNFVRTRTLETDKFPYAEFSPTRVEGIPAMIPTQGQVGFTLTGNMTIHGVTKEVAFKGIATFGRDSTVNGRAKTDFTFATFGLTKPAIGRLMSVDDKIELEVVFRFKRS
jgi:polyisoprenoid-binding protein YceI